MVASCVCIIHLIMKLSTGDTASLSFSALKKIQSISSKLLQHHSFIALLSQYALHGYSGEQELTSLVINDLYYHIHGELEGRQITSGPFQDLLCFLLEFRFFECNASEQPNSAFPAATGNILFDVAHTLDDLGVELWDHSDWKPCKEVAEKMLDIMHKANWMKCHSDAKLCTLRSFITFLSVYIGTSSSSNITLPDGGISATATESAIRCACKNFQSTVDSLFPEVDTNDVLFPLLSGQVDLLLTLTNFLFHQAKQTKSSSRLYPVIVLVMKTSGASTSFLVDLMPSSPALKKPVKSLLVLMLSLFEFIYGEDDIPDVSGLFGESAIISTSLLPVLCKLAGNRDYSDLAIGSMDLLLKGFIPPNVWLPILRKHFHLQAILHKCQNGAILSTQVILNFLLTLGRTKDGAKMLQSANIFAFLKVVLSQLSLSDSCFRNSLTKEAVKRADELEFVDLAHFPELPMPDILHGLQDQVVSIVTEVLEANGSSLLSSEIIGVCHLLLVILETSLYMELCVSQSCGIRPVLGRFEDFSKGIKAMLHALEKHSGFKPLVRSLTQITTLLYPGLAQNNFLI
uniref:Uncharacterized protein n=1 Tax=Avena sativa TaxID=4498 RepID=A0ACD5U6H4_AVESA